MSSKNEINTCFGSGGVTRLHVLSVRFSIKLLCWFTMIFHFVLSPQIYHFFLDQRILQVLHEGVVAGMYMNHRQSTLTYLEKTTWVSEVQRLEVEVERLKREGTVLMPDFVAGCA